VYVLGEERRSFLTGESRGRKTVDMGGCVFGCEKCTRHGRSLFVLERKRGTRAWCGAIDGNKHRCRSIPDCDRYVRTRTRARGREEQNKISKINSPRTVEAMGEGLGWEKSLPHHVCYGNKAVNGMSRGTYTCYICFSGPCDKVEPGA
jgi:hypothetical protein